MHTNSVDQLNTGINSRTLFWFIIACVLVFLPALVIDVINIDAAQYATLSREMLHSKNWLEIYQGGEDYLDKPPLLFWLSAISFKIFGVSNWAYKLPSFLFALLGIYSTIKAGTLLYDKKTGMLAGLMLTFSVGIFVMTNDIRTDTILLGATIFATWKILHYLKTKSRLSFVLGFAGIGIAMLAKGPLGFILPAAALSSEFLYKRQWKNFIRPEWLIGILITGILLVPMCYGLYSQFDLHPEKVVNGHNGVSGLKFYFWTQSFGRITGGSDWGTKFDNGAGPFFFTHTFLWVFFPWSLLFVAGLFKNIIVLIKSKFKAGYLHEMVSTGGFVLVFVALSASRYKLPHYVYVLMPLASIISARFLLHDVLHQQRKMMIRIISVFHWIFFAALAAVASFFIFIAFPGASPLIIIAVFSLFICGILMAWKLENPFEKLMYPLLLALLAFYFTGNIQFYPSLLKYESGTQIGRDAAALKIPDGDFIYIDGCDHSLNFYSGQHLESLHLSDSAIIQSKIKKFGKLYVCTGKEELAQVKLNYHVVSEKKYPEFHVQFLTIPFLLPSSRAASLDERYFLEIN
ncbi:hypothetical protein BH09BAC5_BH09BAC5_04780 [soil metagenome]